MGKTGRTPLILTLLACRHVCPIPGTALPDHVLIAPLLNWWTDSFPAVIQLGIYIEFTGADGQYVPRLEVHDNEGESLGSLFEGQPFPSNDPVLVHIIALAHTKFPVKRPGLYDLVLFMNNEEVARRQLWVRPIPTAPGS